MNVEIGTEAAPLPRKGIQKWDFRCSAVYKMQYKGSLFLAWSILNFPTKGKICPWTGWCITIASYTECPWFSRRLTEIIHICKDLCFYLYCILVDWKICFVLYGVREMKESLKLHKITIDHTKRVSKNRILPSSFLSQIALFCPRVKGSSPQLLSHFTNWQHIVKLKVLATDLTKVISILN